MKTIVLTVTVTDEHDSAALSEALLDLADSSCLCGGEAGKEKTRPCSLIVASVSSKTHADDEYFDWDWKFVRDSDDE